MLAYPKLRARVQPHDAERLVDWLARQAILAVDPADPPSRVADVDDDYLLALAAGEDALLVSGDKHLLALADEFPILPPARFLESIESSAGSHRSRSE